jgi:DMSO reductase anchor subunit
LLCGFLVPAILLFLAGSTSGILQVLLLLLATIAGLTGVVVERWLFFAEARHVVTLFYGRSV